VCGRGRYHRLTQAYQKHAQGEIQGQALAFEEAIPKEVDIRSPLGERGPPSLSALVGDLPDYPMWKNESLRLHGQRALVKHDLPATINMLPDRAAQRIGRILSGFCMTDSPISC
jgi:hypothetical protein